MAKTELSVDDKFELLIQALTQRPDGITKDDLAAILEANSKGMQKAMKPENETHPGKSVFSYPEGEVARPKGDLPFQFFYNGYPCHKFPETETWREWELMREVTPGQYTVIRKDGSVMAVTVEGDRDANGNLTALRVIFPISREEKWLVPPKQVVLYQLIHNDTPRKAFMEGMQEFLLMTMGEEPVAK